MTTSRALLLGVGTFVVGLALCIALFLVLDVQMIFLMGPVIAVGAGSYSAYKTAHDGLRQ